MNGSPWFEISGHGHLYLAISLIEGVNDTKRFAIGDVDAEISRLLKYRYADDDLDSSIQIVYMQC